MPTDVGNVQGDNVQGTKAVKLMIDNKIYILLRGVLYDATGRRVEGVRE
jgi:hypothetical protein